MASRILPRPFGTGLHLVWAGPWLSPKGTKLWILNESSSKYASQHQESAQATSRMQAQNATFRPLPTLGGSSPAALNQFCCLDGWGAPGAATVTCLAETRQPSDVRPHASSTSTSNLA